MKIQIGTIESKYGDPEAFGERELNIDVPLNFPYGTSVYVDIPTSGEWGLKEFKSLMEERLKRCKDPMDVSNWIVPGSSEAKFYQRVRAETYRDVLEMMPEI